MKRLIQIAMNLAVVCFAFTASAVTQEDFLVKNTQSLLNLCTVSADDPLHKEAIHMCHGYLIGAYHYHQAATAHGSKRLVCLPDPPPARNEAFAMFIEWVKAHPQYMNELPVETEFRFLSEKWPCK